MNRKTHQLFKVILPFLVYFVYTIIISKLFNLLGFTDNVIQTFIADLLFLFVIIIINKNNIKSNYLKFVKKYSILQIIALTVKWVVILFIINLLGGIVTEIFWSSLSNDGNTDMLYSIADISTMYIVFKTLIFATIAEELLFKTTIRSVISNNVVFIVVSSLIFALVNIMYTELNAFTVIDLLSYFLFSAILSYIFVKNDDNIIIIILIKFFYNLIPLTVLLLGIGG